MYRTKYLGYLVLLLFSLFQITGQAQANRFGFNAAILYSDWASEKTIDNTVAYDAKVGYQVGVYSVKEFAANWNLSYGLNVALKGFKMNGQLIIPGVTLAANLINHSVYIDVPVAMRYTFGSLGPSGFFVSAGVQFSYLVFNKIEGNVLYNGVNYYGDPENNADQLNRFDLSLYPAIGYQFENGLNFQLFYERGLVNIIKDEEDYLGVTKAFNSVIKFQIGLDL